MKIGKGRQEREKLKILKVYKRVPKGGLKIQRAYSKFLYKRNQDVMSFHKPQMPPPLCPAHSKQ